MNRVRRFVIKLLIVLVLILIWQVLGKFFNGASQLFPLPSEVLNVFIHGVPIREFINHGFASLSRVGIGLIIAITFGVGAGILLGATRVGPYATVIIELLRPISPIAWIPIAILWFGIGETSSWFIIFIAAFFPIFTNTYAGVTSVKPIFLDISRSLNLSYQKYLFHVLLPSALPNIITGIRVSLGVAWMAVIAAEMVAAKSGLGYFIQINRLLLQSNNVVAGMVVIGVIGYVMNYIAAQVGSLFMPWSRQIE